MPIKADNSIGILGYQLKQILNNNKQTNIDQQTEQSFVIVEVDFGCP